MEVAAFAFSGLAVVISALGVLLNDRRARASGRIAQEALDESHKAATNALWSDAIEAAHRVLIDPTTEPVGDKLTTLRVRLTALVDGLPEWEGLDRWVAAEHVLGAVLGREVMAKPSLSAWGDAPTGA